ncbi:LuxR C-terminal-related transcriptional regulator [Hymenobacter koreensis]
MPEQERVQAKIAQIAATAEEYPGVVIIHNIRTASVVYMSQRGMALLCTSMEELRALGPDYHLRFFNPEESIEYVPKIMGLLAQNSLDQITSFFQQVRTTESPDWSLYQTSMRLLLHGDDGLPLLFICFACPVDAASAISIKVQRLLEENRFLRKHYHQFEQLTRREREVLRLLALGHSAPEIADVLGISVQTAETHRRNLRHKLNADSGFELGQYARAFDLI